MRHTYSFGRSAWLPSLLPLAKARDHGRNTVFAEYRRFKDARCGHARPSYAEGRSEPREFTLDAGAEGGALCIARAVDIVQRKPAPDTASAQPAEAAHDDGAR